MNGFHYKENQLFCDDLPVAELARHYATPLYIYSAARMEARYQEYVAALHGCDAQVCYAVKANPNLSVIAHLHQLGAHFDVVSGGELQRVLQAGAPAAHIAFAGVGKSEQELRLAIRRQLGSINMESTAEAERILTLAQEMQSSPRVAIRINPDIQAETHPNVHTGGGEHKFGIEEEEAYALACRLAQDKRVRLCGISCHIGSQVLELDPFLVMAERLRAFYTRLLEKGHRLSFISIGGGFGIAYKENEKRLAPEKLTPIRQVFADLPIRLLLEPGRSLVADAGALLMRIEYIKRARRRNFAIVDAAMNDLLRPSLYDAYHRVQPALLRQGEARIYDLVGPVCETGDWLARDRSLCVEAGDLLALMDCGAYAMSMSSNYNSRNRPAELLVKGDQSLLIRRREDVALQVQLETPVRFFSI